MESTRRREIRHRLGMVADLVHFVCYSAISFVVENSAATFLAACHMHNINSCEARPLPPYIDRIERGIRSLTGLGEDFEEQGALLVLRVGVRREMAEDHGDLYAVCCVLMDGAYIVHTLIEPSVANHGSMFVPCYLPFPSVNYSASSFLMFSRSTRRMYSRLVRKLTNIVL